MRILSFFRHRPNVLLLLAACGLVVIGIGLISAHFSQKNTLTWLPPQNSEGKPVTATEQIVNQTQSENGITIYLRAVYYQKDTLYISFSSKGLDSWQNERFMEVYYNNELISSSGGGRHNRVKDIAYWSFGYPLKKSLPHGSKIIIYAVKSNGEKTNIKFDLTIK